MNGWGRGVAGTSCVLTLGLGGCSASSQLVQTAIEGNPKDAIRSMLRQKEQYYTSDRRNDLPYAETRPYLPKGVTAGRDFSGH